MSLLLFFFFFFCGADGTLTCSVLCTEVTSRSRGQRVKAIPSFDSGYTQPSWISKRREGKLMRWGFIYSFSASCEFGSVDTWVFGMRYLSRRVALFGLGTGVQPLACRCCCCCCCCKRSVHWGEKTDSWLVDIWRQRGPKVLWLLLCSEVKVFWSWKLCGTSLSARLARSQTDVKLAKLTRTDSQSI